MIRRPSQAGQKCGLDWMVGPRLGDLFIRGPLLQLASAVRVAAAEAITLAVQ
jgi:hypothetical protein